MKRINLLDDNTANKIAAGEVVERPSSVVKELVENSIDAKAKNITILIEEGGTSLIKIIDDGGGIHPEDIKKAFLPHATSKINKAEDIFSINTLGFRGEALPSIAAVSKVNIKSKIEEEEHGRELVIEGGVTLKFQECGMNRGTTLEVRDIFYNVPARKKFLKSISRETSIIADIINRIALSNPSVSFQLFSNGKKLLHTYGTEKLQDVLRTVYGKSISENSLYFEHIEDTITIYGYIGKEEIARGSRNNQSIFVNGRYIKNKTLVAAVENAFKSFSTLNKFPFFILFIEVYPELIDVNIHPTKAEIKFTDDRLLFKRIFDAVHLSLKNNVFSSFKEEEKPLVNEDKIEEFSFTLLEDKNKEKVSFKKYESEKVEMPLITETPREVPKAIVSVPVDLKSEKAEDYAIKEEGREYKEECEPKFPPLRIIGQFNKTYIIGEYEGVMYLIDQHAAHEKILFEDYLKRVEEDSLIIQPLLIPTLIDLSIDDYATFEENKEIFTKAGFTLEDFGGNTLSLKEVPYFLGKVESKRLFLSILDNLKELGSGKTVEVKYNRIATMACKSAVKGNDTLSEREMVKLVEDLRYINDPFHCPHGRPTIIKVTNNDFEKMFRRIV